MKKERDAFVEFSRVHVMLGDDYFAELCKETARWAGSAQRIKDLFMAIEAASPAAYAEAVSGSTIPARSRSQALELAKFLADRERNVSQEQWALDHDVDLKRLQRALKRYGNDADFRAYVDEAKERWEKTLSP